MNIRFLINSETALVTDGYVPRKGESVAFKNLSGHYAVVYEVAQVQYSYSSGGTFNKEARVTLVPSTLAPLTPDPIDPAWRAPTV